MARDKTERLLNLLFALMSVTRVVRRDEIRAWMTDLYGADQSDDAFEKMFERDKDELRSMGIPVETVTNPHGEVAGYRIDRDSVLMPAITLTPEQAAALRLAAYAWTDATENAVTQRLDRALEALAPGLMETQPRGWLPRPEPSFDRLLQAAGERSEVAFSYRRPDQSTPERRRVQPWAVVSHSGHWYLVGHDRDREDYRVYRLSRIEGDVHIVSQPGAFTPPDGIKPVDLVRAQAPTMSAPVEVTVALAAGASSVWGGSGQAGTVVLSTDNPGELLERACADAPDVRIVEPEWLRYMWHERLTAAAHHHRVRAE